MLEAVRIGFAFSIGLLVRLIGLPPLVAPRAPVKLVPRVKEDPSQEEPELRVTESVRERLLEVEMAQKMGYLLCKCSWPPQIMVLTGTDHVYRCRRCSRVREM